jgi:hypothetical protein
MIGGANLALWAISVLSLYLSIYCIWAWPVEKCERCTKPDAWESKKNLCNRNLCTSLYNASKSTTYLQGRTHGKNTCFSPDAWRSTNVLQGQMLGKHQLCTSPDAFEKLLPVVYWVADALKSTYYDWRIEKYQVFTRHGEWKSTKWILVLTQYLLWKSHDLSLYGLSLVKTPILLSYLKVDGIEKRGGSGRRQ